MYIIVIIHYILGYITIIYRMNNRLNYDSILFILIPYILIQQMSISFTHKLIGMFLQGYKSVPVVQTKIKTFYKRDINTVCYTLNDISTRKVLMYGSVSILVSFINENVRNEIIRPDGTAVSCNKYNHCDITQGRQQLF